MTNNKRYKCEICGRELFKKTRLGGYILCSKHMHQFHKYGTFLDNIQRTNNDLNDYEIDGRDVYFKVYNQANVHIETFVIDIEDIEKVKYKKWRMAHKHVVTGVSPNQRDISHIILDVKPDGLKDFVVDHIDGNALNNRRENLRVVSQAQNTLNKRSMSTNTSGFIGVAFEKRRARWCPEIQRGQVRCHLGRYVELEEAVYARYIAEELALKEFCNEEEHTKKRKHIKSLTKSQKERISNYITEKLKSKGLV